MGAKGSNVSQTNQSQTYTPAGLSYLQNALQQGQNAAQLPFSIPAAPVAGFSPQQQQAFDITGQAQGQAQPYYNQAAQYFGPQGAQQFFNPFASNVMAQMQNIFGQQNAQNTGNLVQSAGGVGADRIAVGQGELANQQSLAAGQTLAQLYAQAQQQSQQAGQNIAGLGTTAENQAFQGANQLLGTGGLQQQLSQAQLNSPYQLALARAAFPYQQAQFNAGITGALAPQFGGTTTGQGQTTSQFNPSLLGQISGGISALAGPIGYALAARGGAINNPFARGGGVDDEPIDISHGYIPVGHLTAAQAHIPTLNLNPSTGNAGQQQNNGLNQAISAGMKFAPMFSGASWGGGNPFSGDAFGGTSANPLPGLSASDYGAGFDIGGAVSGSQPGGGGLLGMLDAMRSMIGQTGAGGVSNPFAQAPAGGSPTQAATAQPQPGTSMPFGTGTGGNGAFLSQLTAMPFGAGSTPTLGGMKGNNAFSQGMAAGGIVNPFADGGDTTMEDRFAPVRDAIARGEFDPQGINSTDFAGMPGMTAANSGFVPMPRPRPDAAPVMAADEDASDATGPVRATQAAAAFSPSAAAAPPEAPEGKSFAGFLRSPYAALTLGGLEAMRTGSLATGMQAGMKSFQAQETADQAAEKLQQEAQAHLDAMEKGTFYQRGMLDIARQKAAQGEGDTTAKDIVDGMERGDLPPTTTGLYRQGAAVRAEAARRGFNLTQAGLQYSAAQKQVSSLNGPQMTRLIGLQRSVDNSIDEVTTLGEQLHNSGVPILNRLKLQALIQTEGNSPRGQLASRYMTAIGTVKSEFANAEAGGYAPHDAVWQLANQQINGDYGEQQLKASLGEVQRLIRYRINAIPNIGTLGPNAANRYTGATGAPASASNLAPAFTGRTATNKATGQRMREIAPNQWEPIQ